jgi:hypothetical protein
MHVGGGGVKGKILEAQYGQGYIVYYGADERYLEHAWVFDDWEVGDCLGGDLGTVFFCSFVILVPRKWGQGEGAYPQNVNIFRLIENGCEQPVCNSNFATQACGKWMEEVFRCSAQELKKPKKLYLDLMKGKFIIIDI